MADLPIRFRKASPVLTTFDAFDIATGRLIKKLYLGTTVDKELISNVTWDSNDTEFGQQTIGSTTFVKRLDVDFDWKMEQRPLIMKGLIIAAFTLGMSMEVRAGGTGQAYIIIKVRKWDGSSETELVSNQSDTKTITSTNTDEFQIMSVDLDLPQTKFLVGESFRITVELWANATHVNNTLAIGFGCDPKNKAGSTNNEGIDWSGAQTLFELQVPFRTNI